MRTDIETCLAFFHTLGFEAEVTADSIVFPVSTIGDLQMLVDLGFLYYKAEKNAESWVCYYSLEDLPSKVTRASKNIKLNKRNTQDGMTQRASGLDFIREFHKRTEPLYIDAGLKDLVATINSNKDLATLGCCSGHSRGRGYLSLIAYDSITTLAHLEWVLSKVKERECLHIRDLYLEIVQGRFIDLPIITLKWDISPGIFKQTMDVFVEEYNDTPRNLWGICD